MAGFITGNLASLYPGGVPDSAFQNQGCPPGEFWMQPECITEPCPGLCQPSMINAGGPVEINDPTPTVITTVHPFGEDAMDFPKLGALIVAVYLAWKWYAKNNHRG